MEASKPDLDIALDYMLSIIPLPIYAISQSQHHSDSQAPNLSKLFVEMPINIPFWTETFGLNENFH